MSRSIAQSNAQQRFPCHSDRIKCRATGVDSRRRSRWNFGSSTGSRTIFTAVLRYAVSDRRNAERSQAAPALGYLDEPHRRRVIRTRRHPVPDLVQVFPQGPPRTPPRKRHQRHPPRGSPVPVGRRSQISLLRNFEWLCLRQRLLPSLVDRRLRLESRGPFAPPALPGFVANTNPSRPCAPLRYSAPCGSAAWRSPLASERQVPTFHTRASRWSHAVFMPVARPAGQQAPSETPSQANDWSLVSTTSLRFRHFINGSLAFVLPADT